MDPVDTLARLTSGHGLSAAEARDLFDRIMEGRVETTLLAGITAALAAKGETIDEIVGAAEAMRARVTPVALPAGVEAIDTCGTGGDGKPTFNVSSAVAIVAAAAGATVAKHGNRSNSRPSGSAEGLAALGIDVEARVPVLERCLRECRVTFLYAVRMHPAMKHAAPVRRALGIRTIFNLVGVLTNPAGVKRQLLGVNRPELVERMVYALRRLGATRAMVVHGREGLCDLSVSGPSLIARWNGRKIALEEVDCSVIGARPAALESLFVESPEASAAMIESVLGGSPGAAREMVVFNTAAALWVAGLASDWAAGASAAREALDSAAAREVLNRWRELSKSDK